MTTLTDDLADGAIADVSLTYQITFNISEAATASDSCSFEYVGGSGDDDFGDLAVSTFRLLSITTQYHVSLAAVAVADDVIQIDTAYTFTAAATASDQATLILNPSLTAKATASDHVSIHTTYNLALTAKATAQDGVDNRTGLALTASAVSADSVEYDYIGNVSLSENALATDQLTPVWVGNPSIKEVAIASDIPTTSITYQVSLSDLATCVDVWEPNAGTTAWVINTRTNAITQYRNYVYNSFASVGRKYIAASADGLYELQGAQDDTTPVIGDFAGGYLEPNPGKMAGFKGVYMATRGQANWQLELKAGDGREYTYQRLSNPGLMTTKFDIGKGLHSRYFAWRVTAVDGQDFDFAGLELVPSISGRRIG